MSDKKTIPVVPKGGVSLPMPRKLPSQTRSRALVAALVEACLQILKSEGADALTVSRLSEVSGVAVGSIYQYFPDMEAVVGVVFNHVLHEEITVHVSSLCERIAGMSLSNAVQEVVDNMIRTELRLYHLHHEFHLKYHAALQVGMHSGPYDSVRQYIDEAWIPFLWIYAPDLEPDRRDMAAYILGVSLRQVIRVALEDAPEQVSKPVFRDCLLAMALGALGPQATA